MRNIFEKLKGTTTPHGNSVTKATIDEVLAPLLDLVRNTNTALGMLNKNYVLTTVERHGVYDEISLALYPERPYKGAEPVAIMTIKEIDSSQEYSDRLKVLPRDSLKTGNPFYKPEHIEEIAQEWVAAQLHDFCGIENAEYFFSRLKEDRDRAAGFTNSAP